MLKLFFTFSILLFLFNSFFAQEEVKTVPSLELGGALRFNYNLSTWKKEQVKRGGDFGFDVFRINAKSTYKKVSLNAEMRFYSEAFGGPMLKQGWVQYAISDKNNLQIGLTQVPFGNTVYNSHSWFFSMNFYVGLEDDHDMGVKYSHKDEMWEYSLAFFKNAEEYNFGDLSDVSDSRYAYDVSSIDLDGDGDLDLRNKEINQLNFQLNRKFKLKESSHRIGVSTMYGGLLNLDTKEIGSRYAFDIHYLFQVKRFDFKLQYSQYEFKPENQIDERSDVVAMTAYGAPYLVSSRGALYTAGLSYKIPVDGEYIQSVEIYNDFSLMDKKYSGFDQSLMNVTGVLVSTQSIFTYFDFALGKNQPWLGPEWTNALAEGQVGAEWHMRFNINLGYYF